MRRESWSSRRTVNRRTALLRDEALDHFTLGWPAMRRAYLNLGRRLTDAGVLATPSDVFFLTRDELVEQCRRLDDGVARREDLDTVVAWRRAFRDQQKVLTPPVQVPADMRVEVAGVDFLPIAHLGREGRSAESELAGGDNGLLHGMPVSSGVVTGAVRCISELAQFEAFQTGEILVAGYITPAWSPLLARAAGVVTDVGGALSHGSIVAREFGVPVVMGTKVGTRTLRNGQLITVDGTRGIVRAAEGRNQ
jgi:phosphohistidine swiveling domain-containing protein